MAAYFRRRREVVTAEQYAAGGALPAAVERVVYVGGVLDWQVRGAYRDGDVLSADERLGHGVWTPGGWCLLHDNDWIVTTEFGDRRKCSPESFARTYERQVEASLT